MKAKNLNLVLLVFALLQISCEQNHTYPEEIVFDPGVSVNQAIIGESIVFTDHSVGVVSRSWTFPGGIPSTSSEQQVEVSFSELGSITCTIENTFSDGITESKEIYIEVTSDIVIIGDQIYVYNETVSSGLFFVDGSEVANPILDGVNDSENCVASGPSNWSQIHYFPNYIPESGDKIFFSIFNPDNVGPGQMQFEYTSSPGVWQWGGNLEYTEDAITGWVEYSLDISSHADNVINKIILMPAGGSASIVYVDNIYFGIESVIPPPEPSALVYDETVDSGMFFDGNGSEVSNPVSDAVNSSTNCANSGTEGSWQKIQFFPTYTPVALDKLYFSVYNPNGAGPGQVQLEYASTPDTWQWGDNITYESESLSGWVEYSIDLTPHVGNQINKVIVMPAGPNALAVYVDNIYFAPESILP